MKDSPASKGLSLYEAARRFGVPFAAEARPRDGSVEAGGLRFHYLEWGRAGDPAILILHGVAQQCHSWDLVSLALSHRFRVIALDARGHGDTQWAPDADYSLDAHQRDLDGFTAALGLGSFILIGHSMGGRNAYVFASRRPESVRGLVIVDTAPGQVAAGSRRIRRFITLPDELDTYEEFAQRVQAYTGRPLWLVHGSLQHTVKQLPNGRWTWKYDKALRSPGFKPETWPEEALWGCLKSLRCPVLVVRGANSDVLSVDAFEKSLETIPNARGAVVEDAGHLVPGDNPKGFLEAIDPFLRELA